MTVECPLIRAAEARKVHPGDRGVFTIDYAVIREAYSFTVALDGQVYGLIAGDQGFAPTGIYLDEHCRAMLGV